MQSASAPTGQAQTTTQESKGWRISYPVGTEEARGVAIPEAQHRIGPAGVNSAVSLRNLTRARPEDLTKICQHYEAKCGGSYTSDSAAARCLFQLSREVQYVAASLGQENTSRNRASAEAEKLFSEWKQYFGPDSGLMREASSLGIPLTPREGPDVAKSVKTVGTGASESKVDQDGKANGEDDSHHAAGADGGAFATGAGTLSPGKIEQALRYLARRAGEAEKAKRDAERDRASDVAGLREALDAHVAASASSSEADRRMHFSEHAATVENHNKVLETLREQHDQAVQQILVEKDMEFNKMSEGYKKQLNEVQLELLNNRQHMINTEAQWRKRVEELEQRERAEVTRMREHFGEQLSRAKGEAAAAQAALGGLAVSSAVDGVRRGDGPRGVQGSAGGVVGIPGRDGLDGSEAGGGDVGRDDDPKLRSLTLVLDESRKEVRSLRERNQELERVVEALRKTIMRQAEFSSQRQDQQGNRPPTHAWRGGGGGGGRQIPQHQQHFQHQSASSGVGGGGGVGPGSGSLGGLSRGGGGGGVYLDSGGGAHARDDDLLLHHHQQQRHGGVGGGVVGGVGMSSRGMSMHEDQLQRHHSTGVSMPGGRGGSGVPVRVSSMAGTAPGMTRGRSHSHHYPSENLPYRRYASHYDDPTMADGSSMSNNHAGSSNSVGGSNHHRGPHGSGISNFSRAGVDTRDRDLPDRGWSQSAPLPEQAMRASGVANAGVGVGMGVGAGVGGGLGARQSSLGSGVGVGGGGGGMIEGVVPETATTEFAAPVPRHYHHQQNHNAGNSVRCSSGDVSSSGVVMGEASGRGVGGSTSHWDRDSARNNMSFSNIKYPPGTFPSGGVYGDGVLYDHAQRHHGVNGKRNGPLGTSTSRVLSVGAGVGVGVGVGASGGAVSRPGTIPTPSPSDVMHQLRHSQSQGLLGQAHPGHRTAGAGLSHESSPAGGAPGSGALSSGQGSPAISGRGTPGPPPGLSTASSTFSPSSVGSGIASATSSPSLQTLAVSRQARHGTGRSGRGGGVGLSGASTLQGLGAVSSMNVTVDGDNANVDGIGSSKEGGVSVSMAMGNPGENGNENDMSLKDDVASKSKLRDEDEQHDASTTSSTASSKKNVNNIGTKNNANNTGGVVCKATPLDDLDFDFGELDTSAVLGL